MATKQQKLALGVGAGIAAAAAGAALGYYFYGSEDAVKHRKRAAKWANDFKEDVLREGKKLKNLSRTEILSVIDEVSASYQKIRSLDKKDLADAVEELRQNWDRLRAEIGGASSQGVSSRPSKGKGSKKSGTRKSPLAGKRHPQAESRLRRSTARRGV